MALRASQCSYFSYYKTGSAAISGAVVGGGFAYFHLVASGVLISSLAGAALFVLAFSLVTYGLNSVNSNKLAECPTLRP